MTIPKLKAALEKRRDDKANAHSSFGTAHNRHDYLTYRTAQNDLIPIVLMLAEALNAYKPEFEGDSWMENGQKMGKGWIGIHALEQLYAFAGGLGESTNE